MTCTTTRHTASNYTKRRCRCAVGREAWRLYRKRWRTGRNTPAPLIDGAGSRRRVQGLMAMAWTRRHIAAAAGVKQGVIADVSQGRYATVTTVTAAAIRRAEIRLGGKPGPSAVTRSRAASCGYVPLWAWDEDAIDDPAARPALTVAGEVGVDEVVIERAIQAARTGLRPPKLSKAEARAVVVKLASRPYLMHDQAIAEGIRRSWSWVRETRERAGVPRVVVRAAPGRRAA